MRAPAADAPLFGAVDYTAAGLGVAEQRTEAAVDDRLVYAVGDIHGRYDLLKLLLSQLSQDWARRADGRCPLLIFCGDYVDRGPDSGKVLDAVAWLARRADIEVRLLKGNHEQAMLEFVDEPVRGAAWLAFGGAQTLASYGVEAPGQGAAPQALIAARDRLLDEMPATHLRLLQRLETMVTVGDYAFVHAGIRPGRRLSDQEERDLLWIREPFLSSERIHEKVIVHGHTWADHHPQVHNHRIGLDTGAYSTGVLTAVRLEDRRLAIIQAGAAAAQLSL